MFLNIQIDLFILKTYDGQFTLTSKKSLHIIFNSISQQLPALRFSRGICRGAFRHAATRPLILACRRCFCVDCCVVRISDVLALASALCMLGAGLRMVRTALWCALQLTCADLPPPCLRLAQQTARRHLVLAAHHGRGKSPAAAAGGAMMEFWEHGDDVFSDGDEIPEEDETGDKWAHAHRFFCQLVSPTSAAEKCCVWFVSGVVSQYDCLVVLF